MKLKINIEKMSLLIQISKTILSRLRIACEDAKCKLLSNRDADIEIVNLIDGIYYETEITRSRFEELNTDLFERIIEDSKIQKSDISEIILVGGSTRILKIQKIISSYFGKKFTKTINPDEAVVCGAAIQASILSGNNSELNYNISNIIPFSLSISIDGDKNSIEIIERNTKIPINKTITYTMKDNQTSFLIHVFENGHSLKNIENQSDELILRKRKNSNNVLYDFTLDGIISNPNNDKKLHINFEIDMNGILNVSAFEKKTDLTDLKEVVKVINKRRETHREEIACMKSEAEILKQNDEKEKERIESMNSLEKYANEYSKDFKINKEINKNYIEKYIYLLCNNIIIYLNNINNYYFTKEKIKTNFNFNMKPVIEIFKEIKEYLDDLKEIKFSNKFENFINEYNEIFDNENNKIQISENIKRKESMDKFECFIKKIYEFINNEHSINHIYEIYNTKLMNDIDSIKEWVKQNPNSSKEEYDKQKSILEETINPINQIKKVIYEENESENSLNNLTNYIYNIKKIFKNEKNIRRDYKRYINKIIYDRNHKSDININPFYEICIKTEENKEIAGKTFFKNIKNKFNSSVDLNKIINLMNNIKNNEKNDENNISQFCEYLKDENVIYEIFEKFQNKLFYDIRMYDKWIKDNQYASKEKYDYIISELIEIMNITYEMNKEAIEYKEIEREEYMNNFKTTNLYFRNDIDKVFSNVCKWIDDNPNASIKEIFTKKQEIKSSLESIVNSCFN